MPKSCFGSACSFNRHSGTSWVSSSLAPAAPAAAVDALTDVYGDGAGPESSIGDDHVTMTDDHVFFVLHGVLAKHCSTMPCHNFRLGSCSDRCHWGLELLGFLGLWSPRVSVLHVVLPTPCSPCPATTSVWLPALAGTTGVLPVLCASRISWVLWFPRICPPCRDCHALTCLPCHATTFVWLPAMTGVVGTFCTVF